MSWLHKLFRRKTVGYVSDIDKFNFEWDMTHAKTASQQAEIQKYKRIYLLRDHPQAPVTPEKSIWPE
jgi:hypothetical protein